MCAPTSNEPNRLELPSIFSGPGGGESAGTTRKAGASATLASWTDVGTTGLAWRRGCRRSLRVCWLGIGGSRMEASHRDSNLFTPCCLRVMRPRAASDLPRRHQVFCTEVVVCRFLPPTKVLRRFFRKADTFRIASAGGQTRLSDRFVRYELALVLDH